MFFSPKEMHLAKGEAKAVLLEAAQSYSFPYAAGKPVAGGRDAGECYRRFG